ncbi:SanA/YdcF family protein [Promicromonospora soli]|uniref:Membrane protein n=1 Tax=Promicromonospora soli TaxID=2035533 RepID=A0A919FU12_9MICO|nr:YdcF family protein [Promicromonospora soli]GHH72381.1 membrane protein [Promicromonospora soli]
MTPLKVSAIVAGVLAVAFTVPVVAVQATGHARVRHDPGEIEKADAIIVLGAGLRPDGTPSTYLRRRVEAGAELYRAGIAPTVILSGDAHDNADGTRYDEPGSMRSWILDNDLGVPDDAIALDREGFNTTATCRRAYDLYDARTAVVVTQGYHLRRALYSCVEAGLDAVGVGVSAASVTPVRAAWWHVRELPASWKAAVRSLARRVPV